MGHTVMVGKRNAGARRWLPRFCGWTLVLWLSPLGVGAAPNRLPQYAARLWQMEDGLPHTIVQSILQARDGYLWLGTREGLARFDGHSFVCLTAREFGTGLVQPSVVCLSETPDGSIWVGTENVGLFRLSQGRLARFGVAEGLRGDIISGLQVTADGSLWIAASGLARYREGKLDYPFDKSVGRGVASLFLDDTGVLWVNGSSGVRQLRGDQLTLFRLANGHPLGLQRCLVCDRHGTLWGGQPGSLLEVREGQAKTYPKAPGAAGIIGALLPDREGNLWVGAYAGVSRFVDGEFVPEKDERGESYRVFCFLQDREGNVWLGSEEGLVRLTPQYFTTYTKKDGLSGDAIAAVCADHDGGVWISVWGSGLNHFANGSFSLFDRTNGLSSDFVMPVHEARDGSLWVGTDYGSGLNRIHNGQVTLYKADPVFTAILEDEQGRLWIGSRESLTCLKDGKFERYTTRDGISASQINALCLGQGGVVWVGTQNGLTRRQAGRFENLAAQEPRLKTIILSLYEDRERALWVGTRGAGLLRWREGRLATFTSGQGLLSDSIYAILEDERGNLWFNSSRGIFRVSKAQFEAVAERRLSSLACASYGKMDGVAASSQYREVTQPAACKALDGRLWFRSTHGVAVVDPNTTTNRLPPLVAIEQILTDQRLVGSNGPQAPGQGQLQEKGRPSVQLLPLASEPGPRVRLRPGRGELEVRYTALSFRAPEKNQFRYQLEGVDQDWVEAGSRRVAYYNNLAPGEYAFRVTACNNDGVWNEAGAAVRLVLEPHPWQTWWFRAGCGLGLVGAVGGTARYITRRRMRRRLQQLEQQHDIESERGRIARDLHDNLGTRLTEILMLNEATWRHADAPAAELKPRLEKSAALVRDLAGSLDAIVWAADPKNDTLDQFILYVYEYLDSLAPVGPRILRDVPAELPACPLSPAQRHNLFLVLKEALNNAFKHAGATEIWFRLRLEADRLLLTLEDNGKGFEPAAVSQLGNGLVNMEKRMKLIGGACAVESQPGAGTRVRLQMQLKAEGSHP